MTNLPAVPQRADARDYLNSVIHHVKKANAESIERQYKNLWLEISFRVAIVQSRVAEFSQEGTVKVPDHGLEQLRDIKEWQEKFREAQNAREMDNAMAAYRKVVELFWQNTATLPEIAEEPKWESISD